MNFVKFPFECCSKLCCCGVIRRDIQQINALVNKTITLQLRHWCTNLLQLSLPLFVLLVILLFQWLSDEIMQPMLQMMLPEDAGGEQESLDVTPIPLDVLTMQAIVLSQNSSVPCQYLYSLDDGIDVSEFGSYSDSSLTGFFSRTPNIQTYLPYFEKNGNISYQKASMYRIFSGQDEMDEELYDRLVEAQGEDSTQIKIVGGYSIHEYNDRKFSYTLQYENDIERKVKPSTAVEMDAAAMGVDLNISKNSKTDFCKMAGYISNSFECENMMKASLIHDFNHAYILENAGTYVSTKVSHFPFHREKYVIKMRYDEASGGFLFPMVIMLLLPVFAYNLVLEKENQIREMMKLMGMRTRNYVAVHVISMFLMYAISQCLFVFLAYFAFRFRYFTESDPFLLLILFVTCGFHLISVSFLISSVLSSTLLATVLGYLIVLIAPTVFVTVDTLVSLPMNWNFQPNLLIWKFLNFVPLWGICDLFYYSTKACISMNCMEFMGLFYNYDMLFAFVIMNLMTIVYFFASFYFEAVFPQKWGVRKNPCFCFGWLFKCCCWCCPCYWGNYCDLSLVSDSVSKLATRTQNPNDDDDDGESKNRRNIDLFSFLKRGSRNDELEEEDNDDDGFDDEDADVRNERIFINQGMIREKNEFGVIVNRLVKKYGRSKLAVDKVHFKIPRGECFALLGPNGAGKTTCIRMLCGLFAPTSGEAYVNGRSIRREMGQIWAHMGLCPQFDVIWPEMTPREHLLFYARLKGVSPLKEQFEVDEILTKVGLQKGPPNCAKSLCNKIFGMIFPCEKKAKSLPLGERRRLSIGISLIGSPDILFLDEPTTGLDIESRSAVWKLIEEEKKDKCVILTTHSMEEADVLSDRIGIMARGKMKCIGSSFHLKSKFGTGFTLKVNYEKSKREELDEFITGLIPKFRVVKDFGDSVTWEISKGLEEIKISHIFSEIEKQRTQLGISDWAITQPTLEDVFLNIITDDEEKFVLEKDIARRKGLIGWKKWWHCWKWGKEKKLDDEEKSMIQKLEDELEVKRTSGGKKKFVCVSSKCVDFFSNEMDMLNHFYEHHEDDLDRLTRRQQLMINDQELKDVKDDDDDDELSEDEFDIMEKEKLEGDDDDDDDQDTIYSADVKDDDSENSSSKSSDDDDDDDDDDDELEEGGETVIIVDDSNDGEEQNTTTNQGDDQQQQEEEEVQEEEGDEDDNQVEDLMPILDPEIQPEQEEEQEQEDESYEESEEEELDDKPEMIEQVNLDENKRDFVGAVAYHYYKIFSTHCFFLTLKNLLLTMRKWKTTCFQIFIPVLLTLLLLFMYLLGKIDNDSTYLHPETEEIPDFVKCKKWNGNECYTLAYTTNGNTFAKEVMLYVLSENPNLQPCQSFFDDEHLLNYLADPKNANRTQNAVSFSKTEYIDVDEGAVPFVDYTLYFNTTTLSNPKGDTVSQTTQLKIAIDNAILKLTPGSKKGQIDVKLKGFPKIPIKGGTAPYDIYRSTGPMFLGLTAFFILSCALYSIVSEKPQKKSLRIAGMDNMAYWSSWFTIWIILACLSAIVQVLCGLACWIPIFLNTNVLISFLFHFLYYISVLSLTPLFSVFLNSTKSTLLFSFIMVFVAVFMNAMLDANLIYSLFDQEGEIDSLIELEERMIPWYLCVFWPPFNYAKIYGDIGFKTFPVLDFETNEYKKNDGYGIADLFKRNYNKTLKIHAPASIFSVLFLLLNTAIFLTLGWYFDNVFNEKNSLLFFIDPSYWRIDCRECLTDESTAEKEEKKRYFNNIIDYVCCNTNEFKPRPKREKPEGEDTLQEYEWVRGIHNRKEKNPAEEEMIDDDDDDDDENTYTYELEDGDKPVLQMIDLIKTYSTFHFFRRKKAIKGINLGLSNQSCLVLLGPNGAGKTTMMDSVAGSHSISPYSDIKVFGRSIKKDLPLIRPHFGVVDQYDLLWDDLTAREHIILFSIFKPNRKQGLLEEVKQRLTEVGLWDDRSGLSKTFSGGMKRRLSVAIGMCGNPSLFLLDEPSTGVDPYSKRQMWNLIYELKKVKGVLLTTHSMEEAEALSDRIAVIKEGELLAIGDALYLKGRFGAGYTLNLEIDIDDSMDEELKDEIKGKFENWLAENKLDQMEERDQRKSEELVELDLPTDFDAKEILRVLHTVEEMEERGKGKSLIKNWGISKKTLEQVYIKLMRDFELKKNEKEEDNGSDDEDMEIRIEDSKNEEEDEEEIM